MFERALNFVIGLALVFFIGGFMIGCSPTESGAALGGLVTNVGQFFGGFSSTSDVETPAVG